jgi:hypothetical protein
MLFYQQFLEKTDTFTLKEVVWEKAIAARGAEKYSGAPSVKDGRVKRKK